jgi:hypothetical protein
MKIADTRILDVSSNYRSAMKIADARILDASSNYRGAMKIADARILYASSNYRGVERGYEDRRREDSGNEGAGGDEKETIFRPRIRDIPT